MPGVRGVATSSSLKITDDQDNRDWKDSAILISLAEINIHTFGFHSSFIRTYNDI